MPQVLVADDDAGVRDYIVRILKSAGHKVTATDSALDAWSQIRANTFDLAVIDVVMPNLHGTDLIPFIPPEIPVIVISGQPIDDLRKDALKSHRVEFLPKPFMPADLLGCVNKLLTP